MLDLYLSQNAVKNAMFMERKSNRRVISFSNSRNAITYFSFLNKISEELWSGQDRLFSAAFSE